MARRYHQNAKRWIQETRPTNSPLIHIMCALRHRLDEIQAQILRQHAVLNSPELLGTCHAYVTATLQLPVLHRKDSIYVIQFFKNKKLY